MLKSTTLVPGMHVPVSVTEMNDSENAKRPEIGHSRHLVLSDRYGDTQYHLPGLPLDQDLVGFSSVGCLALEE